MAEHTIPPFRVKRFSTNPLITPASSPSLGNNINGPSVIRTPDWLPYPLGRYYMYFAHHSGAYIRLAYADQLEGPWKIHEPGTLRLKDADAFHDHIASPDVHIDDESRQIRMYFHGPAKAKTGQWTGVAYSKDGLFFTAKPDLLGKFYFRVWQWQGLWYALAKNNNEGWGELYRGSHPDGPFELGGNLLEGMRHGAVLVDGHTLHIFFSRIGDAPERILLAKVDMRDDWMTWHPSELFEVVRPIKSYEGVQNIIKRSRLGPAVGVHQLQDPFVMIENGHVFIFYTLAGEAGIGGGNIVNLIESSRSRHATSFYATTSLVRAHGKSADDPMLRIKRYPRNIWTRLQAVLHLIKERNFYAARRLLGDIRYHIDLPQKVSDNYFRILDHASALYNAEHRINIPTDYLSSTNPRLLLPFRRLQVDAMVPKAYPWAMVLPNFIGTGNDYRFLKSSADQLSGSLHSMTLRVHVVATSLFTESGVAELVRQLRTQDYDGRIDATVFGNAQAGLSEILPRGGRLERRHYALLCNEGLDELARIACESDLVVFLAGRTELDPMALRRLCHITDISDSVVLPLVPLPDAVGLNTLYSDNALAEHFKSRYPFREVAGLNMAVPTRLLREVGLPDKRFCDSFWAAKELAYRLYARGAWFVPIALPVLEGVSDTEAFSADSELYNSLCPNHWDREHDCWHNVPKVSVYIPAYNASKYIERAVESVLSQDVADLEVCIANDGSRDGTLALLERLYYSEKRVRWLDSPNGGIGFASNSAIRMSNSLYIGQLDSDDCLKAGAVRRLMTVLDEHPTVVCAYSSCERIDEGGNFIRDEYSWPIFSREKMMITSIAHHFRMFRRQAWERTNRFREDIMNGVDYDIFLKLSEVGEFCHIDEKFYQRRWHGENTSHVNEHQQTTNTHRVQREALARLGLDRFWDIHIPNPEQPRVVTYKLRPETKVVLFWPDYSQSNPYQRLLYAKLRQRAEVMAGDIDVALRLIESNFIEPHNVVFHLHWLNFLFSGVTDATAAQMAADAFIAKLEKFTWKGGRLVWTVHNIVSHDTFFHDLEVSLSTRISAIAHRVHLHSIASIPEVTSHYPLPKERLRISRHGNYIGAYADYVSRDVSRASLGLEAEEDVILFTGQIRPYKGIDTLVSAFCRILADRPQTRLVLAGRPNFDPLEGMNLTKNERTRIFSTGRFVEDGEWQLFFRAADIAAYPYKTILTSGSLMLALSYGVPTVVPRFGMTAEVLDGRNAGRLYDEPGGIDALEAVLRDLLNAKDEDRLGSIASNARAVAETMDWPDFGDVIASKD